MRHTPGRLAATLLLSLVLTAHGQTSPTPGAAGGSPPPPLPSPESSAAISQYGTPFAFVPEPKDAVIYQVNFRAFAPGRNFAEVEKRLDAIEALGANVVYLLPVQPIGVLKGKNSPYSISDYKAVNPEFGDLDGLRHLVAEAHKRKMAVLLDWVANHTAWDNVWMTHKSWYMQDAAGNVISPPNTGWNDVAALNFQNADMRRAMIDAMEYWVYTANIDGFRCDTADFQPPDFWKQAITALRAIPGHKLLMFAEGGGKELFNSGFQMHYGFGFFDELKKIYIHHASVRELDALNEQEYTNAGPENRVVRYTSNHDVDSSDGTPLDLFGGEQGSLGAFIIAADMKGTPMIYCGQEVGCPVRLDYLSTKTAIYWSKNAELTEKYRKILAFRSGSEALKQGALDSFSTSDVCAFTKTYGKEQDLVLVNTRSAGETVKLPAKLAGTKWKNADDGSAFKAKGPVTLKPYEYEVYAREMK